LKSMKTIPAQVGILENVIQRIVIEKKRNSRTSI